MCFIFLSESHISTTSLGLNRISVQSILHMNHSHLRHGDRATDTLDTPSNSSKLMPIPQLVNSLHGTDTQAIQPMLPIESKTIALKGPTKAKAHDTRIEDRPPY